MNSSGGDFLRVILLWIWRNNSRVGLRGMLQLNIDWIDCLIEQLRADLVSVLVQNPSLGPLLCRRRNPFGIGKFLRNDVERGRSKEVLSSPTSIILASSSFASHHFRKGNHYPIT